MKQELQYFKTDDFHAALRTFFKNLNVPLNYIAEEPVRPQDILSNTYKNDHPTFQLMDDVYFLGMVDDAAFEGNAGLVPEKIESDYDGILIFGVTLKPRDNGLLPTRSQLAEITRSFNREYHYTPVVVVFKYENHIAFANAERLKYKQEWREGEKAGKVSLLRDIDLDNPHSGHLRILSELAISRSGKKAVNSFSELYTYWQSVFNVSVLNKKFYEELSNWYFWAVKEVSFPSEPTIEDVVKESGKIDDKRLEELKQEHNAKNVIRLLTRFLFVWFVKEKKLIPNELFDLTYLKKEMLKDLSPYHDEGLFKEANIASHYYKAVLQNLFFATLNCPIKSEAGDKRNRGFSSGHFGVLYLMRYGDHFKDKELFLQMVNKTVPFLNGGLFECLDVRGEKEKKEERVYIDGFSDNLPKEHKLIVPDYLFFGLDEEVDLSSIIGITNKKTKQAAVKGLIKIFNDYKFTIAENTPIEEDIALDPELLGKVFENLLASYNPETKNTARKQTGSFYTPREIVNYMVDESLISYLKSAVKSWDIPEDDLDTQLHQLFSFDATNPFSNNKSLQSEIIKALDHCTILDPACGSGAFPMGILQKMVHVLQKVDPENLHWRELQMEKALQETESAFHLADKEAREQKLIEINEAFDSQVNDPDYARKLFLIENCIYGVDIQPIAVQISKLRSFISLVVDQKVDKSKDNFGIRPLPNLETKFIAANTLVGIENPENLELLDRQEINDLEGELKKVRHRIFSVKTPSRKRKLRDEDLALREKIGELLVAGGWENRTARQLSRWDPYNQNTSSPFFDSKWMFGIKNGFDVVIGNPPWGANLTKQEKVVFKECYPEIDSSTPNSFAYFIGASLKFTKSMLCFVLPDSILIKDFLKTRILIKDNLTEICWYLNTGVPEEYKSFVYVEHDVCTLFVNRQKTSNSCSIKKYAYNNLSKSLEMDSYTVNHNDFIFKNHEYCYNLLVKEKELFIYNHINGLPILKEFTQCHEGIHTGNSREILFHNAKINDNCKPLFFGGRAGDCINNYHSERDGWYVDYRKEIILKEKGFYASLRNEFIFKLPKIYITRTGNPFKAFYDNSTYASNNFFSLQLKDYSENTEDNLKAILPLLLSTFANYFIRTFAAPRLGHTFVETKIFHLLKIPVSNLIFQQAHVLRILTDLIVFGLKCNKPQSNAIINIVDALIFEMYFQDHMIERKVDILELIIMDLDEIMLDQEFEQLVDKEKESIITELHNRWTHPDSEVRNRIKLFAVRSPEILKPILESK